MNDLRISVAELLGRPGEYRDFHLEAPMGRAATALAEFAPDAVVSADLRAESVMEGVLVTGRASGPTRLQCARCLREWASEVELELCELFVAPGQQVGGEEVDSYRISGTEMDLAPMLRDAVTLALPLKPLCGETCQGLCATCGRDLNLGACGCKEDTTDPRWAALTALRDKLEI